MQPIRKLYFQNEKGERRGLNGERGVYAKNLAGLGYSSSDSYADIGSGFFSSSPDVKNVQHNISFVVVLTRYPYPEYQDLVNWISAAEKLTLIYDPAGSGEFYRDITVKFLQKSELVPPGWLELPCSFVCHTPWYSPTPVYLRISKNEGANVKRYSYRYSSKLRYGSDSPNAIRATIYGAGHIPGAFKLAFQGTAVNPVIRLMGNRSGRVYGTCRIAGTFEPGDTLEYSSLYDDAFVAKVRPDGSREDLLSALDLRATPFFRLPVNEPSTLSIEADTEITGQASMMIYRYYRSV